MSSSKDPGPSAERRRSKGRRRGAIPRVAGPPGCAPRVDPDLSSRRVRPLAAVLALVGLWTLLFSPQIFASRIFVVGDAPVIRAFSEYSQSRWYARHERTHWNPFIYGGVPATASLHDSRPQWLPDRLIDLFDGVHRLPGFPPLAIPLVTHLAGMIGAAFLARGLWRAGTTAMVWAGSAWGLMPSLLVPFAFGQDSLVMSGALMPVILLMVHLACSATTGSRRRLGLLGLSLTTAGTLLAAHPQLIAFTVPLAVGFAIERITTLRQPRALFGIGVAVALGAAMASATWWPARLFVRHTVRGDVSGGVGLAEVASWSAGLPDLLSMAWPWMAGFGGRTYWGGLQHTDFPQYLGITVAALGLWGLGRRDGSGRAAAVLVAAAVVAALLAVGVHLGSLHQFMYEHVPAWSSFRVSIRALIVTHLAFALLSARGLERLGETPAHRARATVWTAAGIAAAGVIGAVLLREGGFGEAFSQAVREARPRFDASTVDEAVQRASTDFLWRCALLSALLAAVAASARRPGFRRASAPAALAVLAIDLGTVSLPFLKDACGRRAAIEQPEVPAIARLASADSSRVLDVSRRRMYSNDWIRWRVRSFTGNHAAVPKIWVDVWKSGSLLSRPVLGSLAIRYLAGIEPRDTSRFEQAASEADQAVWRAKHALPRAYAVSAVVRREDDHAVLKALGQSGPGPPHEVFTADEHAAGRYPGSATCRIGWIEDEPDRLILDTASDSAAFLVIADTWFPGWSATLDGNAWPIHRVQHLLRGVVLPPGTHRLRLDYLPEGWDAGVTCARIAWIVWLLALAVGVPPGLKWPRPNPRPQPREE